MTDVRALLESASTIGARVLWIEPEMESSDAAREIVAAAGLAFVDGESIATAVVRLGIVRG